MRMTFVYLLALALLTLPSIAETPDVACPIADSSTSPGDLIVAPLPWTEAPVVGMPTPENAAVAQQAPVCPAFRPCSGNDCWVTGTCSFTNLGKRCCYTAPGQKACCPQGQTAHQVNCGCAGSQCDFTTHQTVLCF